MTDAKTTRELVYETNRDVKWICQMLARMEAQDEEFESRIRALEGWRAEKAGEERRVSTVSAGAGGVVGGAVAVIVRVLRRAGDLQNPGYDPPRTPRPLSSEKKSAIYRRRGDLAC